MGEKYIYVKSIHIHAGTYRSIKVHHDEKQLPQQPLRGGGAGARYAQGCSDGRDGVILSVTNEITNIVFGLIGGLC